MHETLLVELDQGIEPQRMLDEPLYARDVLLVCDAMAGSELPALAKMYRKAAVEAPLAGSAERREAGGAHGPASGLGAFFNSIFGSHADTPPGPAQAKPRGWFGRSSSAHK